MKLAVLGCGIQAKAVVSDLLKQPDVEEIVLADHMLWAVDRFVKDNFPEHEDRFIKRAFDASSLSDVILTIRDVDACISAVPYKYNFIISLGAIESCTHMCDLGGNDDISKKQAGLDAAARSAGVAILRELGLAPGLVSNITEDAVSYLDETVHVRLRVGGIPAKALPDSQLNYFKVFSTEGLINEYREPVRALRGGEIVTLPPLSEIEVFPDPYQDGYLEAFTTSGGAATLPDTFKGKVANLDYKTIRYPGHVQVLRGLMELGMLEKALREGLDSLPTGRDRIIVRCHAWGTKDGKPAGRVYSCNEYGDDNLSAMAKMTGYPASIALLMLGREQIQPGVAPQETVIDSKVFLDELKKRGIKLKIT